MERTGGKKERNDEKEEEEGRKDRRMVHRASENIEGCTSRACTCAYACTRMCIGVCIPTCVGDIRRQKLCVGRIQCKRKDEEYDEDDGRVQGGRGGEGKKGRERHRDGGREKERRRARKRRGEATAIPDFHFN